MIDWIFEQESVFTDQECDNIIEYGRSQNLDWGTITNSNKIDPYRKSKITWLEDINLKSRLYDIASYVNINVFGFDCWPSFHTNDVQFTEYSQDYQGYHDWHIDSLHGGNTPSTRKISLIVQLTDENSYTGGQLKFKIDHKEIFNVNNKKRGSVILFPSFIMHKVEPVESGTRNSLVTWVNGPHWK